MNCLLRLQSRLGQTTSDLGVTSVGNESNDSKKGSALQRYHRHAMEEEASVTSLNAPNDWLEHVDALPDRPKSLQEERFKQFFSTDVEGRQGHDMYVSILPNGVCVVGLAPSHPLIQQHRLLAAAAPAAAADQGMDPVPMEEGGAASGAAQQPEAAAASSQQDPGGGGEPAPAPSTCPEPPPPAPAPAPAPQGGGDKQLHAGGKRGRQDAAGQAEARPSGAHGHGLSYVDSFPLGQLKQVNFEVGRHSRLDIKGSGKKKPSPGTVMKPDSCLCRIESTQGQCVSVAVAISGRLLEVNSRLLAEPKLLFDRPCREGYLAILYPNAAELRQLQQQLLPLDQYLQLRGVSAEDFH